jgi:hypothetical protein
MVSVQLIFPTGAHSSRYVGMAPCFLAGNGVWSHQRCHAHFPIPVPFGGSPMEFNGSMSDLPSQPANRNKSVVVLFAPAAELEYQAVSAI